MVGTCEPPTAFDLRSEEAIQGNNMRSMTNIQVRGAMLRS